VPQTSTTSRIASATSPAARDHAGASLRRPRHRHGSECDERDLCAWATRPCASQATIHSPSASGARSARAGEHRRRDRRNECERVRPPRPRGAPGSRRRDGAGSTTPISSAASAAASPRQQDDARLTAHRMAYDGRGSGPGYLGEVADALGRLKLRQESWSAAISSSTNRERVDARDTARGLRPARLVLDPGEGQRELVARKVMWRSSRTTPMSAGSIWMFSWRSPGSGAGRSPRVVVHAGILEACRPLSVSVKCSGCSGRSRHGRRGTVAYHATLHESCSAFYRAIVTATLAASTRSGHERRAGVSICSCSAA